MDNTHAPDPSGKTTQEIVTKRPFKLVAEMRAGLAEPKIATISPARLQELMTLYQVPTAYALQTKSGVAQATIRRFLRGKGKTLHPESLARLAAFFKKHAEEFRPNYR